MDNRLQTTFLSLVVLAAVLTAGGAWADTESETLEQTFDLPSGGQLVLGNVNGEITIEGWDEPQIEMKAVKKVRAGSSEAAREALEKLRIEIDRSADRIGIKTVHPKASGGWKSGKNVSASVRYYLKVPAGLHLEITTVNGEIDVDGVEARMRLRSTNGAIEVAGASGSVSATTTNGRIRVGLDAVAGEEDQRFSTTNGSISVAVPGDLQADLHASTVNGSIETDLAISIEGRISRRKLQGKINGGGPELRLSTTNGSIRLTTH